LCAHAHSFEGTVPATTCFLLSFMLKY